MSTRVKIGSHRSLFPETGPFPRVNEYFLIASQRVLPEPTLLTHWAYNDDSGKQPGAMLQLISIKRAVSAAIDMKMIDNQIYCIENIAPINMIISGKRWLIQITDHRILS